MEVINYTPEQLFESSLKLESAEKLKFIWSAINIMIYKIDTRECDKNIASICEYFIENNSSVSVLRMLLNAIKPISDQPVIIPVHNKLIEVIEKQIGKIY